MAGACTGVRRFSIARAPNTHFIISASSYPTKLSTASRTLPPPRNSTNATSTPREDNEKLAESSPPTVSILSFGSESSFPELPHPASSQLHRSSTNRSLESLQKREGREEETSFAVRKTGHIRISSPHAIPLASLSAYHDVRRGLVIPVGGHYQCRQPVPAGLLHHYVQ